MRIFLIAVLSLSLLGAAPQPSIKELTCEEVSTSITYTQKWLEYYAGLVRACDASLWETRTGECIAATMAFDALVDVGVMLLRFKDKMDCRQA